jgi:hypothetical protein
MNNRDEYIRKTKAKLDEWDAEIDKLAARAEAAQADARIKYHEHLETLRKQRDENMERLRELQTASEGAWESVRKGMEDSWERMNKAFKDATDRFK